jgi:excisionase family DNA binding protein
MVVQIALSIPDVCAATQLSRTAVYQAIASGALRSFKSGRRRLVHVKDIEAFLLSLRDAGRSA